MTQPGRTFGRYHATRPLHLGAITSTFAAARPGEPGEPFAVRACRPPVDVVGIVAAERAVRRFLARAELQRAWAAKPELAPFVAPIHDLGLCPGVTLAAHHQPDQHEHGQHEPDQHNQPDPASLPGAYFVTDLAALGSIHRIVRIGAEIDRPTLQAIASKLAAALAALERHADRGHGALTPANVLLTVPSGQAAAVPAPEASSSPASPAAAVGSLANARVLLTDPAPDWNAPDDEARDVRAFAEIVHLLVVGKPFLGGWAAGSQKRWAALGPSGAGWRKFVESVLDPAAPIDSGRVAGVGIADLPAVVDRLGRASRRRRGLLIASAAALVLALSAGGYAYKVHLDRAAGNVVQRWNIDPDAPRKWADLCDQYRAWFAFFLRRLEERPSDGVIQAATATLGEGEGARPARIASRRDLYRLDSELQALIGALDNERIRAAGLDPDARSDPWSIAGVGFDRDLGLLAQQPPERAKHDSSIERTERLLEIMSAVRDGLANWKGPDVLRDAAREFNALGWTRAGGYLDELSARFTQTGQGSSLSDDVAGDLDAVVAVKPTVDQIRSRWQRINELLPDIASCDDPVAARFAPSAAGLVPGAGAPGSTGTTGRPADLRALNEQLARIESLAVELAAFAKERWPAVDTDSLRESAEYAALAARERPDADAFRAFMSLCAQHPSLDPQLDPRRTWTSPTSLAAIDSILQDISSEPLPVSPEVYDKTRLDGLRRDADAIASRTVVWNRRNQARIEGEVGRLDGSLTGFLSEVQQHQSTRRTAIAAAAESLRADLRAQQSITASPAIDAAWQSARDALITASPDERFPALRASADALREGLRRVDASVPAAFDAAALPAGADWAEALIRESRARRESVIAGVVAGFAPTADAEPDQALATLADRASQAAGTYRAWLDNARAIADRATAIEDALRSGYASTDPLPAPGAPADQPAPPLARAAQDLAVASDALADAGRPMRAIAERIDRLRAVEQLNDPAALLASIRPGDAANGDAPGPTPEIPLAAWKRLGTLADRWPVHPDDLDALAAARATAAAAVAAIPNPDRAARLRADLIVRQTAAMLSALCERLTTAADLERVLARRTELEVAESDLSPSVRFNAVVLAARRELSGQRLADVQTADAAKGILARLEAAGLSADDRAARVLAQVREIADYVPPKVELIDPKTLGPAKLPNWSATEDPESGRLTFRRTGQGPELAVEFDRVEADDTLGTEAFYMTRHEVSLGLAIALLAGEPVRGRVPDAFPAPQPEGRVWSGARVWRLEEPQSGRRIVPGRGWIFIDSNIDERHPAYPPEFLAPGSFWNISDARGGEPSLDHPVQRISFASAVFLARLANCRLPSGEEWSAAHKAFVAGRSQAGPWNVRDRTFDAQTNHVQRMRDMPDVKTRTSFQWPNVGGVFAEPNRLPEGKPVPGSGTDDGVLYFAKVDAPFGEPPHLIGNVAEFVFDDPVAIEQLPPGDLTAAVRLYNRFGHKIRVAGGSAISPTQIPADVPQKLNDEQIIYAEEGFADVGLRLAFSAKGTAARQEPLIARLTRRLSDDALLLAR